MNYKLLLDFLLFLQDREISKTDKKNMIEKLVDFSSTTHKNLIMISYPDINFFLKIQNFEDYYEYKRSFILFYNDYLERDYKI